MLDGRGLQKIVIYFWKIFFFISIENIFVAPFKHVTTTGFWVKVINKHYVLLTIRGADVSDTLNCLYIYSR